MATTIGVILSTYDWPAALEAALVSLEDQGYRRFEVVVADDGSERGTARLIERLQGTVGFPLRHVWQEDRGYRLGAARNRAVAASESEYLIFLDGDCVFMPDFLERHARLAEPRFFVKGSRVQMSRTLSQSALSARLPVHRWSTRLWLRQRILGNVHRFLPFLRLPLGPLRKSASRSWGSSKGCNLAVWRDDFVGVNGFNEEYEGWGEEDIDLALRLIRNGVRRKDGRFAVPVIHHWHEQREHDPLNRQRFERQLDSDVTWVERGVSQYL